MGTSFERPFGAPNAVDVRTAKTGSVGSDQFVRAIVPTCFFAYQFVVILRDSCSVGALSDAIGEPAFVTDGAHERGIFDDTRRALIEQVLEENEAIVQLRLVSNKAHPEVDSLLSQTECSTGNMAACKALAKALFAVSQSLTTTSPSDLSKLQADTDPSWSVTQFLAAPVSNLP